MLVRRGFVPLRIIAAVGLALALAGCSKKSGEAIVVSKEHIDAREPDPSPSPGGQSQTEEEPVYSEREMAPDEIVVEGHVMKKEVRGTSRDPRAATEEQWRVTLEMLSPSQTLIVRTDRAHYDKLKKGDRVKVKYSQGNYTGTVWGAEIVD